MAAPDPSAVATRAPDPVATRAPAAWRRRLGRPVRGERIVRSLRFRALFAVIAVVLLPMVLVWLSDWGDRASGTSMGLAVDALGADAAEAWRTLPPQQATPIVDRAAMLYGARVRVVTADGEVLQDVDREVRTRLHEWAGTVFFGPDGAPSVAAADAGRPPVHERVEVRQALADGVARGCEHPGGQPLLVCWSARRVTLADGRTGVVYAQDGSRRAIRALYDVRYQLLKLMLYMLLIGGLLALWLGARLVRPIELLRDQVLLRKAGVVEPSPVALDRQDEIGDLARAFDDLLGALDDRNRANAVFIADLAHELKNPVAAIRACAESLGGDRALDPDRAKRLARILADSSGRLDALVTQFLELARAEAGLPGQSRAPVPLRPLLMGLAETWRHDARYPGVRFEVDAADVTVEAVPERLETALRNLLDNAASFAGEGGTVTLRARLEADEVVISVSDSGPGLDEADLPHLFERFFTRRADKKGTGLGLALVRAIAEAHDGRVEARSPAGEGATFVISWPVHTASI